MMFEPTFMFSEIPPDGGIESILFPILVISVFLFAFYNRALTRWFLPEDDPPVEEEIYLPEQKVDESVYHPQSPQQPAHYYVVPNYLNFEPFPGWQSSSLIHTNGNLFNAVDKLINEETETQFIILLADAGMGKSSFSLNYHDKHRRRLNPQFKVILLPLGAAETDKYILQVKQKHQTVIFLDSFNEDVEAAIDPVGRLYHLMDLTRGFKRVIITCRTRFFPEHREAPGKPDVYKINTASNRDDDQYTFYKLYIAPFSSEQVDTFLKQRFQMGQTQERETARKMIAEMGEVILNPIFLARINELAGAERKFNYHHELYEEMIKAWTLREAGIIERFSPTMIRQLAQELAVNMYANRKRRLEENIPPEEFAEILKKWNVEPGAWPVSKRSLLAIDRQGNYKFIHRSFMEFLCVERFMEGDETCRGLEWSEQMQEFLWEKMQKIIAEGETISFDLSGADLSLYRRQLRFTPLQNLHLPELQPETAEANIRKLGLYDLHYHPEGRGCSHLFEMKELSGEGVIIDHVTTLMWQPAGSPGVMSFEEAEAYIANLNETSFTGFKNWRLPTLEEALSLMKPQKEEGFHIDSAFSGHQNPIWTADREGESAAWIVRYDAGFCHRDHAERKHFVRGVRAAY